MTARRAAKGVEFVVDTDQALTDRQEKLLHMLQHGGMSKFMAMVASGSVTSEDVSIIANAYRSRANPSVFSKFAQSFRLGDSDRSRSKAE